MRGEDERSGALFSYVDIEALVPMSHPLRAIRELANEALAALAGEFSALYASTGRPSIPPEKLLRAVLLQAFYSIRSERLLMERLDFDLLFRCFVGRNWEQVIPFFAFPEAVRRIIYTTNAIESLNAKLRRAVRTRDHFPTDDAAMKLLYLVLRQVAGEWKMPPREWCEAENQFAIMFEWRFAKA